MFAKLCVEHSPDSDGEAILFGPGVIPGHDRVKGQLPLDDLLLADTVPKPVKARGQGNGSLHFETLGDHDDVNHSQLRWHKTSCSIMFNKSASLATAGNGSCLRKS